MANPLRSALGWLRGDDLKSSRPPFVPLHKLPPQPVVEEKLGFTTGTYTGGLSDAIRLGLLVHGPGAGDAYRAAYGFLGYDCNSAVLASVLSVADAYAEAPLRVYERQKNGARPTLQPDHPLELFMLKPHPFIPPPHLSFWVQYNKRVDGNAYLVKQRSGAGNVVALRPFSPLFLKPVTTKEDARRGVLISYYNYEYESGKFERIPAEDVIHFRLGLDPLDPRMGCAPLKSVAREVMSDDEVLRFTAALLQNNAVAGAVITIPPEMRDFSKSDAENLKDEFRRKQSGDMRGDVAVLTGGAKLDQTGFSPEQLNLRDQHRTPEERISGVLRVPAIIAGLGAGLDRSTYTNMGEAREMFTEMTLAPSYLQDAATWTLQLLPEFTPQRNLFCQYDLSEVRALQEDKAKQWVRLDNAVDKWITKNEARAEVGLPPIDGGDAIQQKPEPNPNRPTAAPPNYTRQPSQVRSLGDELLEHALAGLATGQNGAN